MSSWFKSSKPATAPSSQSPTQNPVVCTIDGNIFRLQYKAVPLEIYYGVKEKEEYRVLLCHMPSLVSNNILPVYYNTNYSKNQKLKKIIIKGAPLGYFGIENNLIKTINNKVYIDISSLNPFNDNKNFNSNTGLTKKEFFDDNRTSIIRNVIPKTTNIYDELFKLYCPAPKKSIIPWRGGITKRRRNTKRRRYTKRRRV